MEFSPKAFVDKSCQGIDRVSYEDKVKLTKEYVKEFYSILTNARLKYNPNTDKGYLKEAANMCIATMIAYSAGGNGGLSRKEYQFCRDVFGDDYKASYDLSLNNYDAFCYAISGHDGRFWTDNFLEISKYISAKDMETIATFMILCASADGDIVSAEKNSIIEFLNKCCR